MNRGHVRNCFFLLVLLLPVLAGCNAPKSQLSTFGEYFRGSDYEKSIEFAQSKISKSKNPKKEDLLWTLQLGSLERLRQNHQESNNHFDRSEEMLNFFDYQNTAADSVAAIAVNENIVPYLGEEYDGIMVNTYKALNFMALGENEKARVEFNRALDRQRRAKEKFAKEIEKLQKELDKAQEKEGSQAQKNADNPEIDKLINNRYPGLYEFEAYPDFVNPFTTYIAGVFFNLVGDHSKAVTFLKESYGMVSDNEYLANDLAVTEKILDGQAELKDTVWVIFENGLGPVKDEFRIDIPLFIASDEVKYFGIALPMLRFREQAYPYLSIKVGGKNYNTQIVANIDRVVQTEFSKDFKGILTRAIISATAKVVAQYALNNKDDSSPQIVSFLATVYSYATTAADVRIWTTLPKNFQVARLPIPPDRLITIAPPGGESFSVEIPACNNAFVYVRMPQKQTGQVLDLITY
ncbi:COG3014 family protein [Planctomycetota bacterium]